MSEPTRKLPHGAVGGIDGDAYQPLVAPGENLREFTFRSVLMGAIFGVVFGAANAYLGLKVGITVSTSIPIAVMTVAFLHMTRRASGQSTILESNMSQTIGSARRPPPPNGGELWGMAVDFAARRRTLQNGGGPAGDPLDSRT